ncbi:sensor histidine kinase [Nonomuraea helvata]|uniref:histidine kinase n=1 Tax=Nonomuraea helvata TaxID=37484 RepID=A0ABV5SCB5_9ACTN
MSLMWVAAFVPAPVPVAAVATVLFRRRLRSRLPALVWPAAAVSLAVTLACLSGAVEPAPDTAVLWMFESLALMALTGLAVRYAPPRQAAAAAPAAGLAASVWLLRSFTPASPLEGVGVCAFWSLGALLAAAVGGYLRHVEARETRAVADARTALRLRLAGDLHDFVAHDISEMVAHAQAGTVTGDPLGALERVEAAGQRALSMLDRTLDMLHHDRPLSPPGDLNGIREAAERFSAAGAAQVSLRMDPLVAVPAELGALAYRIVVEGLTNVRRHAPRATRVDLAVSAGADALEITMANDGVTGARGGRRGGSGLAGLAALVQEQGGDLVAGRRGAVRDGWSLAARLPLAQSPGCPPASSSPTTRKASAAPSG